MIICGIAAIIMGMVWISGRKRFSKGGRKASAIILASAVLGAMAGIANYHDPALLDGGTLVRRENGEGSYQQELVLGVEGEAIDYKIEVPEQSLTEEMEWKYLEGAREELRREFPGENESVNCIREKVVIREEYQGGKVLAEWSFDNYRLIDFEGNITAEELPKEGELVKANVKLSCGTSNCIEEFYFQVFPPILSKNEIFFGQLETQLRAEGEQRGKELFELPKCVGQEQLTWKEARDTTPEKIFLFGVVLAAFVPLLEQNRQQEQEKKRKCQLEMEYPDMVSKMALLLSSGMTLQASFRKIAFSYEAKRDQRAVPEMPAYEEMLITCHEMESGMGEQRAYERFAERCKLPCYRKFGNMLAQNLKKGSKGMIALLEQEAENAFEERKAVAKRYGEEAGTKLLFPMIIMLGIVMLILIIPAVFAFQI